MNHIFFLLVFMGFSHGSFARKICADARKVYGKRTVAYKTGADICTLPQKLKTDPEREERIKKFLNDHCVVMIPGFLYKKEKFEHSWRFWGSEWWRDWVGSGKKDTPIPFKAHLMKMKGNEKKDQYSEVLDLDVDFSVWGKKVNFKSIEQVADDVYQEMKSMSENPKCKNGFVLFGHSKGGATIHQLLKAKPERKRFLKGRVVAGATIAPTLNGSPLADLVIGKARSQTDPQYKPNSNERHVMRVYAEFVKKSQRPGHEALKKSVEEIESAIQGAAKEMAENNGAEKVGQLTHSFRGISVAGAKKRRQRNMNEGRVNVFSRKNSPIANITLSTQNDKDTSMFLRQLGAKPNDRLSRLLDQIERGRATLKRGTHVCEMGHRGNVNGDGTQCTFGLMIQAVESAMVAAQKATPRNNAPVRTPRVHIP